MEFLYYSFSRKSTGREFFVPAQTLVNYLGLERNKKRRSYFWVRNIPMAGTPEACIVFRSSSLHIGTVPGCIT
jgi:hypothetical protein